MTAMAAEVGAGAVEAEGTESAAGARRITARTRTGGGRRAATRVARATPQGRTATRVLPSGVARNRRVIAQGGKKLTGNYHGAVFGEFVLAVLLVAAIPFSKPNRTGVSPYAGKDMIQLLAITVVYFLLAILAATGRTQARFAAWFGALLLLAVGLAEAAAITEAVRSWFGTPPPATPAPAGNASVVNPTGESPTGSSRAVAQDTGTGLN